MKRKIIILMGLVFILCGCSAEVNVNIDNMIVNEDINIDVFQDNNMSKDQILKSFRDFIPVYNDVQIVDTMPDKKEDKVVYYNKNVKDLGTGYRINYKYDFNLNNYVKSRTVSGGFKSANILFDKKEKTILLSTAKGGISYFELYPSLEQVKINLKTSYKVKENNADSVNGDVYTWIFYKNSTDKNIYILLDSSDVNKPEEKPNTQPVSKDEEEEKYNSKLEEFFNKHPFLVAVLAITLFIIVVLIINKIQKLKYMK